MVAVHWQLVEQQTIATAAAIILPHFNAYQQGSAQSGASLYGNGECDGLQHYCSHFKSATTLKYTQTTHLQHGIRFKSIRG